MLPIPTFRSRTPTPTFQGLAQELVDPDRHEQRCVPDQQTCSERALYALRMESSPTDLATQRRSQALDRLDLINVKEVRTSGM